MKIVKLELTEKATKDLGEDAQLLQSWLLREIPKLEETIKDSVEFIRKHDNFDFEHDRMYRQMVVMIYLPPTDPIGSGAVLEIWQEQSGSAPDNIYYSISDSFTKTNTFVGYVGLEIELDDEKEKVADPAEKLPSFWNG